jgi:cobalt/nickel transport system permease protein
MGTLSFFKDSVYAEEYASLPGLLQARDPRMKVLSMFLIIMLVMFTRDLRVLFALYLVCLSLAITSKIGPVFFLKRTWIFIPLFSFFIAVPALFDVFTPGKIIFSFSVFSLKFSVTQEGLSGAALFVSRVITSVSFVILLSLTTRNTQLLKALRTFKVPQIFVVTLGMCYRYIYLFVEILEHTFLAIKSRVGVRVHHKKGRELVAWNIANLWLRSYNLNNQVYNSMLSRGYTGEPQVLNEFKTDVSDWLMMGFSAALLIIALR